MNHNYQTETKSYVGTMSTIIVINQSELVPNSYRTIAIHRPFPLGNPYRIGRDGTREQVIALYRKKLPYFYRNDPTVRFMIDMLVAETNPIALQCYCAPAPCHGDVIKEFVETLRNPERISKFKKRRS